MSQLECRPGQVTMGVGGMPKTSRSLMECRQEKQREQEGLWVMCRMEEAKLLWAQGQQSMAMRVAWALLGSSGSAAPMEKLQRSRLQSLLGKWLSLNRCGALSQSMPACACNLALKYAHTHICQGADHAEQALCESIGNLPTELVAVLLSQTWTLARCSRSSESSSTILDLMTEALKNAEEPSSQSHCAGNEVACRAAFRLATYADSLYRAVQEQISSPKWATAVAIIQDKKRQVGTIACLLPSVMCDEEHASPVSDTENASVLPYKEWYLLC